MGRRLAILAVAAALLGCAGSNDVSVGGPTGDPSSNAEMQTGRTGGLNLADSVRDENGRILVTRVSERIGPTVASKEELYRAAGSVLTAVAIAPEYGETHPGFVYTLQRFEVDEVFVGVEHPGDEIVVQFLGGEGARLPGAESQGDGGPFFLVDPESPPFSSGERYLLFLEAEPSVELFASGARTLVANGIGQYLVIDDQLEPVAALRENPVVAEIAGNDYSAIGQEARDEAGRSG
ncbi:MAG: hypothetical protein H0W25_19145 [Acidimicrobiia bacterium]|nr:hypothetical protein [Acidimicrobiia bacterium]